MPCGWPAVVHLVPVISVPPVYISVSVGVHIVVPVGRLGCRPRSICSGNLVPGFGIIITVPCAFYTLGTVLIDIIGGLILCIIGSGSARALPLTRIITCPVALPVAIMVTVVITIVVAVPVSCGPPVTIVGRSPSDGHPSIGYPEGKAPAGIGVPPYIVTIGHRSGIIMRPIPWAVIISCPVIHTAMIGIGMHITWCIAHINHFRCGFVDVNVFHIIHRRLGGYLLDCFGNHHTHHPWTIG